MHKQQKTKMWKENSCRVKFPSSIHLPSFSLPVLLHVAAEEACPLPGSLAVTLIEILEIYHKDVKKTAPEIQPHAESWHFLRETSLLPTAVRMVTWCQRVMDGAASHSCPAGYWEVMMRRGLEPVCSAQVCAGGCRCPAAGRRHAKWTSRAEKHQRVTSRSAAIQSKRRACRGGIKQNNTFWICAAKWGLRKTHAKWDLFTSRYILSAVAGRQSQLSLKILNK